jgi:PKD repeat protein
MSRSALILVCIICVIFIPIINAESVNTDQNIIKNSGLKFTIKDCTDNVSSGKETPGQDSLSSDQETLQIPPAVKKYERVTFDHPIINTDLRSKSPHLSFQIDGKEYPTDLKRMDFESIDDGIDSYSGTLAGEANSSVLLTISDNATIGSITLNDETYYIEPVQLKDSSEITNSIPHIIYSSKDVEEQKFLIDNGPINSNDNEPDTGYLTRTMDTGMENIQPMDVVADGRSAVTVLVVTDNQFYSDHSGSGWKIVAQDIIAETNRQFGRDDIGVILIPVYDDSKRQNLTNHLLIRSNPSTAFQDIYPISLLNENSADLGLYLGGYDKTTGNDQGGSDGYGNVTQPQYGRYSWAQMVPDDIFYLATLKGRRVISIHELGHQFGAHHDDGDPNLKPDIDTPGYNRAFGWDIPPFDKQTVMWHYYSETASTYEFSSSSPNYHGDISHDNARRINETKGNVAGYAGCSASIPSADFEWSPDISNLPAGQKIQFSAKYPVVNNPVWWYWEFGDGATSTDVAPDLYAYSEGGTYTVKLTVANCAGSSITEHNIIITNPVNIVDFFGAPLIGDAPLTVHFADSSSPSPSSWNWSFGDGNTSIDPNPQHTYNESGNYTVTLTVIQNGVPSTKILQNYITVARQAPNASFTSFINSGSAPLFIQFNDTSVGNPTSWNWSFDDGTVFNTTDPLLKNPGHSFDAAGTYTVTLTAANYLGSNTTSRQITATDNPPPTNTSPFEYSSAGSYTYTSPAGIYLINITIIGAGGGGGGGNYDSVSGTKNGGYGGNASQVINITQIVSPGSIIPVKIGTKGSGGGGRCGQINGTPGSHGGYSSAGTIISSGGLGGSGGVYSSTISHEDGYPGQNGSGTGQYATSGQSYSGTGGTGGIGRGAGGGGESGGCPGVGGNGANGYVKIQPVIPLLADFTASPTGGTAPLTVQFTDTSTGSPTGWLWDFGDGNTTNATKQNPVHTYSFTRDFINVSLTVMNAGGSNMTTKDSYISTCMEPPVAKIDVNTVSGAIPLTVAFNGSTIRGSVDSWLWNFGDGQTSTLQNPVYLYTARGNYTVSLTVTNAGETNTRVLPDWIRAGYVIIPVNDTQNNSTITVSPGDIIRLELTDYSLFGRVWSLNTTPGLEKINNSYLGYSLNPVLICNGIEAIEVPGIMDGIDVWDIAATGSGEQNVTAALFGYNGGGPIGGYETFRLNITVNVQSPITPPVVTGLSNTTGPIAGGTPVTIYGSGFGGTTEVDFGTLNAPILSVSDTEIHVTSPYQLAPGIVDVQVKGPHGNSDTSGAADNFTYTDIPIVTGISPTRGPVAGGTNVTISGSGFVGTSAVQFGSVYATILTVSDSTITVLSPGQGSAGTVNVTVTKAGGTSATSDADKFTYTNVPIVTGISPTRGPKAGGTNVAISGSQFAGTSEVRFGSTVATIKTVSATTITVISPRKFSAGTVDVRVVTANGTSAISSYDRFTYL